MDKNMKEKIDCLSGEFKSIKVNQVDILELQNTVSKIQKSSHDFNQHRLDTRENGVDELKNRSIKDTPAEA